MNKSICRSLLFFSLFALLSACAPERQLTQPVVKVPPGSVETRPGWQIEWDRVLAEAKKEGKISLYEAYGLADARDIFEEALMRSRIKSWD